MIRFNIWTLTASSTASPWRLAVALPGVLVLALGISAYGQQPANPAPPDTTQQSAAQDAAPPAAVTQPALQPQETPAVNAPGNQTAATTLGLAASGAITEEQLKQLLVGKDLFLRGGYLGDSITFNEMGMLNGHAPLGSYTLCAVRIDKVHLSKGRVELQGARYGMHFLGALPYEDPTKAVDRVRITPKKKVLRLSIERVAVVKAKKEKVPKQPKGKAAKGGKGPEVKPDASAAVEPTEANDADQLKAEDAATPVAGQPTNGKGALTTTSPAHASRALLTALNNVFATGIDDRMLAAMPTFWRLYYQAVAAKTDYTPADPAVMRQTNVDTKAKLLTNFEPGSNEFAQANGVAGMALYHVVIGANGTPGEIAVARPIGFGLDENAVESIRKASFSPAVKEGKPVPVLLDLVVQFRIYSKRTAVMGEPEPPEKAAARKTPGPYSVQHP
jgi:TonB family protein